MSNVVSLQETVKVLVCDCGCASFSLTDRGEAECTNCESLASSHSAGWLDKVESGRASTVAQEEVVTDVHGNGSVEFARRRVARLASDDDAAAVIIAKESGAIHSWTIAETSEQLEWLKESILDGFSTLEAAK